jgi:hypothetical protein
MIQIKHTTSGKTYQLGELKTGHYQYVDRLYQFNYIPKELNGCIHIMPYGNDKLISDEDECVIIETDCPVDIYVLYPDKQPVLPNWMYDYEKLRMNVTRIDSEPSNLKGYFSLYRKHFEKGSITLYGNSPKNMLEQEWYTETNGANYCMYSIAVKPSEE